MNPLTRNPHYPRYKSGMQYLESGIQSMESRIQDCILITLHRGNTKGLTKPWEYNIGLKTLAFNTKISICYPVRLHVWSCTKTIVHLYQKLTVFFKWRYNFHVHVHSTFTHKELKGLFFWDCFIPLFYNRIEATRI